MAAGLDFTKGQHDLQVMLAPEHVAGLHLRILAHISRLLSDESFRRAFLAAETDEALRQVLAAA